MKQDTALVSMSGRSRSVRTPVKARFGSVWVTGEQECFSIAKSQHFVGGYSRLWPTILQIPAKDHQFGVP